MVRAGTRLSENFNKLLITTALPVSSFHHPSVQAVYPDAVAPVVETARPEVAAAPVAVAEPAPSRAERAAAVAEPPATGESVPVWSFFLFAAAEARPPVAAPKAHFEL